jgi:phage terminase large subunit-like protein
VTSTMTGQRALVLPRIGTLRNFDRETIGPAVGEVARRLGRPFMPWQQYTADVAGEVDPATGRLWYDEIDVSIMRQCGKTTFAFVEMLHRMTVVPHRHGRQRATFTMQKRDNARRKLERDFAQMLRESDQFLEIKNPKARPGRSTKQWKLSLNNGSEHMLFGQGNYLQIDTPSKQAGHGDTLDLGVIDEARFHVDDRVEQAMRPAQATRADPQLIVSSTAGDEDSFYLWRKVLAGRRSVEAGESGRVAYLEWSLPDGADLDDPDVWWEHHPALGHTIDIEFIMAELARARRNPDEGGEDTFRQEYANQWVRIPVLGDGVRERVIDLEQWASRKVAADTAIVGDVAMAVDVSPNGHSSAIAVAGRGLDGVPIVDVLAYDAGTFWLETRIADQRDVWTPKVIGYGPGSARAIAPEIGRGAGTVPVKDVPSTDYGAACEAFVLAVHEGRVRHLDQAWLNSAVDGAAKKVRGAGWLWDRQTASADVTSLVACTVALRLLEQLPAPETPFDGDYFVDLSAWKDDDE